MNKLDPTARLHYLLILGLTLLAACAAPVTPATSTPAAPTPATTAAAIPAAPTAAVTPTLAGAPPRVSAVAADHTTLGRYERIELTAALSATYDNPYDQAQVALSASFLAPSGAMREVPGFWDGRDKWKVRFTPDETGAWRYAVHVRDRFGTADSSQSSFDVTASNRHGWLQIASWHDSQLSPRYLVYHDGTPFYGVGRCEAFTLGDARTDAAGDLNTLKRMHENGENLVVWWPHYSYTFFSNSASRYERVDMQLIDSYLASAERLGITVVYTIWDYNLLRGDGHPWGARNSMRNGAGSQQDAWHAKINDYFVRNDPYRHPTTASLSGDKFWPAGYAVTDIPQIHVYAEQKDALKMSDSIADWTTRMWQNQARPNVVGEFGTTNSRIDPALVHNGIWAGLASGAAITPLRWSDRGAWGRTRDTVMAQLHHLSTFVADIPFPSLDLQPAQLHADSTGLTARGLSGDGYAIVWVQARQPDETRTGASISISGLQDGAYVLRPFDTWEGNALAETTVQAAGGELTIALPEFRNDIALKLVRKT